MPSADSMTQKVKWGVLGTGRIAGKLLDSLGKARNAEPFAVASRDENRARETARKFGAPKFYRYDDLLQDPAVEAVYISLPNGLHAAWTIKAARAGKHILCEKPLASDAAEADAMIAAAQENNVLLMEAFMYRFHPQWKRIAEIVQGGEIGALGFVRAAFSFAMGDTNDIRFSSELAGGALMDVGCYCLNFARFAASLQNLGEPQAVFASANFRGENGVDETLAATLRFEKNLLAQFVCSIQMPGGISAELIGDAGKIEIANPWLGGDPAKITVTCGGQTRVEEIPGADNYVAEVEHFSDCIRRRTPLFLPPSDARANMNAIDALLRSAREGREIKIG